MTKLITLPTTAPSPVRQTSGVGYNAASGWRPTEMARARAAKNLTQRALATQLDVPQSSLALWESGRRVPRLPAVRQIADALDVPIETLVELPAGGLERLRVRRGLLQSEVAEVTGIPRTSLQHMETRTMAPTKQDLIKLASAYDVDVDEVQSAWHR